MDRRARTADGWGTSREVPTVASAHTPLPRRLTARKGPDGCSGRGPSVHGVDGSVPIGRPGSDHAIHQVRRRLSPHQAEHQLDAQGGPAVRRPGQRGHEGDRWQLASHVRREDIRRTHLVPHQQRQRPKHLVPLRRFVRLFRHGIAEGGAGVHEIHRVQRRCLAKQAQHFGDEEGGPAGRCQGYRRRAGLRRKVDCLV